VVLEVLEGILMGMGKDMVVDTCLGMEIAEGIVEGTCLDMGKAVSMVTIHDDMNGPCPLEVACFPANDAPEIVHKGICCLGGSFLTDMEVP